MLNHILQNNLNKRISEVEEILKTIENMDKDSIEYKMNHYSFTKLYNELLAQKQELDESYGVERINFRIRGKEIGEGVISSRILSTILSGFQAITDSIANAIGNSPTYKGPIPKKILNACEFNVVGCFTGSFGLNLEAQYEPMFSGNSLITQTMYKFIDLLYSANDPEKLQEELGILGQRTLGNYKRWLKNLCYYEIDVDLNWINSYAEKYYWDSSSFPIDKVIETLDTVKEETTEEVILTGKLTGINIRRETFEIVSDDGVLIEGKSKFEVLINNAELLDKKISAKMLKTTTRNINTYQAKVSWFLEDIKAKEL